MPKIKIHLGIGFSNANMEEVIDFDDVTWDGMTPEEREAELEEIARDFGNNHVDLCAWVVEEDE